MIEVGYLGPRGTFSQEAVDKYVKNRPGYTTIEFNTISDVISAVQNDVIKEAVTPIENSLEGAINVTLDMLAAEVDLKIKGEVVIAVRPCLLVKRGTDMKNIKYILSHPQPLGQCRKFLNSNFPYAEIKSVYSTSFAAEEVAKGGNDMAAVGSVAAAKVYDLEVCAEGIQDGDNNSTRFVVLSKEDCMRTGNDKTSIVFSTDDKPGSLYRILDIFNLWDINMTRIESRPAKNQLGRYIFFVDIHGHIEDEDVKSALIMVRRKTSFYKFLGSYPVYAE